MNRHGRKRQQSQITVKGSRKGSTTKIDFATAVADDVDDYHDKFYGRKDKTSKRLNNSRDELIYSDDESDRQLDEREYSYADDEQKSYSSSEDSKRETVDEKRLRLAREYLHKVEKAAEEDEGSSSYLSSSSDDDVSDDEVNPIHDKVSNRLSRERLKQEGRLETQVATSMQQRINNIWAQLGTETIESIRDQAQSWVDGKFITSMKGHDLTPTCVALHMPTGDVAYSGSKDGSVLMWDIEKQCRLNTILPHWKNNHTNPDRKRSEVLALACSDDGRYLASGGRDNRIKVYDIRIMSKGFQDSSSAIQSDNKTSGLISTFDGHKGPVTTLAFRSQSLQLFSGSDDRCIRHFDLSELSYVETLYGHQAGVTGIACCTRDMPFSVGRDRTARAWKLNEETHLIFRGGSKTTSADCITSINDDFFLTGHDDGALNLWCKDKKKPFATVTSSHGQSAHGLPRGIICCSSLGYSDIAVTGSNDGYVRYWKVHLFVKYVFKK